MRIKSILLLLASAVTLSGCNLVNRIISMAEQTSSEESSEEQPSEHGSGTPGAAAKHTILMYVCGSTLEYGPENPYSSRKVVLGAASADILEMVNAVSASNDVNVVIETGGSEQWASNPGISANYLERYHVKNHQLIRDAQVTKANMGLSSTLESFLKWGVETYPAEKYGLVLWNHGGAVSGVCFDDNYSMNGLLTSEVATAVKNTIKNTSATGFEWIGYDACIMNFLDNASVNADYFNYMVASQELENGDGWDYSWLTTLINNPNISTPNLLKDIASKFVAQYGTGTDNDQCLSVIDLSKMANFTTKFNAYAANFKNSDFSNIESIYNGRNSLVFGEDAYGIMDFKDFLDQAKSKFSYSTSEVESAFSGLVVSDANIYGKKYSSKKPCGINIFIATGYDIQIAKSEYGTSDTKLSNWRTLNINNGSFYSGYSY